MTYCYTKVFGVADFFDWLILNIILSYYFVFLVRHPEKFTFL